MQTLGAAPTIPTPSAEELEASVTFAPEQAEQEAQPQPEQAKPEIHNLSDFEQLLGQSLPEEIKQQVDQLKQERTSGLVATESELDGIIAELESGSTSKWIKGNEVIVPSLVDGIKEQLEEALKIQLEQYKQTEAGQKDQQENSLHELLDNPYPILTELKAAADFLDVPYSKLGLKLSADRRAGLAATVKDKAKLLLYGKEDDLGDKIEHIVQTPEQKKTSDQFYADRELRRVVKPVQRSFEDQLESRLYRITKGDIALSEALSSIAEQETARRASSQELLSALSGQIPAEILSLITKGSLNIEDTLAILEDLSPTNVEPISNIYSRFIFPYQEYFKEALAEPSLLGLDIGQEDVGLVEKGLDKTLDLASLLGQKPANAGEMLAETQKDIEVQQKQFFERMGSESDLYWHFSPVGLRIFKAHSLQPNTQTGNVNTSNASESLHFVKPGTIGINSQNNYSDYAERTQNIGNAYKGIPDAFGVAVIYPLGAIAEKLPMRDEPREQIPGTSNDVIFKENEEEPSESLPLESAYILPMQTSEQINLLREDPDYKDIFTESWQAREELAEKLTKRALELAGYKSEWIDEHVLPAIDYKKGRPEEREIYSQVSQLIYSRLPESRAIIVPIQAKRGALEESDSFHVVGGRQLRWREELVKITQGAVPTTHQ